MNLRELCDWVYYIHLDMIERRITAERTGMIVLQSMVEGEVELPDVDAVQARYDELLNEAPKGGVVNASMVNLRKALGV